MNHIPLPYTSGCMITNVCKECDTTKIVVSADTCDNCISIYFTLILLYSHYHCIQMNGISTHVGADSTSYSHELPAAAEGEHYTGLARSTILLWRA